GFLYLYSGSGKIPSTYKIVREIREDFSGYHTYNSVKEKLFELNEKFKDITELKIIGKTYENRDIYALFITKKSEEKYKPTILVVGCHHAREWMSVEIPMKIIEFLLLNYEIDEKVKNWVDNYKIIIIPILNPDGFEYSIYYDRMWRKNRVLNFDSSRGVDNNRNYGYKWGLSDGSSSIPSSETYRGPSPFSELENKAIRDLVYENPPSIALSYHSFSELILYPWGYTSEPPPDKVLLEKIAVEMAKTTGSPNDNDYPGPYDYYPMQSSFLYPTSGDLTDFLYGEMGSLAYTIELNSVSEFFDPPPELIEPTWNQTKDIFSVAMNYVNELGLLSLKIINKDGKEYEGDVTIVERNLKKKTELPGIFNYFLTEGEYTVSVQGKRVKVAIKKGEKSEYLINLGEIKINTNIIDLGNIDISQKNSFEFEVEGEGEIKADENIILSKYEFQGKEKISGFIKTDNLLLDKDYEFIIKLIGKSDTKEILVKFKLTKDITPPEIKFNIEDSFITNKRKILINGETEKDALIYFNDNIINNDDGKFSIEVNLNEGLNELKFKAVDLFGNSKDYTLKIFLDTLPPEVKFDIPETFKTTENILTLKGYTNELVDIFINNNYSGKFSEGDFEIKIPLYEVINKLKIEVYDLAQNKISLNKAIYKIERKVIELFVGDKKIYINGLEREIDVAPFILNGRVYVPIRFITESLGGNVIYNDKDKSISFVLFDKSVLMWVDKKNYFVNFKEYFMDSPPFIIKPGRVMVPLRFIAEAVDAKVLWDGTLKKITIIYPDI
ncbi:MAG: hypothetical protein H5U37_05040, partial [Caldisericia bacterium]|nr:hypothetical protein [Caldisericia bacterium]